MGGNLNSLVCGVACDGGQHRQTHYAEGKKDRNPSWGEARTSPSASAGSGTPIGAISSEDSAKAAADEAKAGGNGSFMEKGMLLL